MGGSFTVTIVGPTGAGRTEESHCPWVSSAPIARYTTADNETARTSRYATGGPVGRSGNQRQRVSAAQLARRCLGNRARGQHHHIARSRRDFGHDFMSQLMLDAPHLRRVSHAIRFHGYGKRFPGMAGVEAGPR